MANYLLTILLFFVPFLIVPFGNNQFEIPKVIVSELIIITLWFIFLFKQKWLFFKTFHQTHLFLVEILVLLTIYQLFFLSTPLLFFGDQFRLQGIFLLWLLLVLSLLASQMRFKSLSVYWYGGLLFLLTLLSVFLGNQNGRAVASIGEPNALAAFVIFLWPFLYFSTKKNHKQQMIIRSFSILLSIIIIFLSGSRSGVLAFGIQIIFYVLWFVMKISRKKTIAITIGVIAMTYTFPFFETTRYENRADIWKSAIQAGLHHPIFGGGFGNMDITLNQTIQQLHNSLIGYSVDSTHNILLDWWVQGGIAGLLILLLFLVFAIYHFYKQDRGIALLLFFGMFTTMSFNPSSVITLVAFWWLIGTSFAKKDTRSLP